jgi:hypothetical protein
VIVEAEILMITQASRNNRLLESHVEFLQKSSGKYKNFV